MVKSMCILHSQTTTRDSCASGAESEETGAEARTGEGEIATGYGCCGCDE